MWSQSWNYLRAIITADFDLVDEDDFGYRIAFIEAFQRRGIFPDNVKNMSVASLLCRATHNGWFENSFSSLIEFFKIFKEKISYVNNREEIFDVTMLFISGGNYLRICEKFGRMAGPNDKLEIVGLHERIMNIVKVNQEATRVFGDLTGMVLDLNDPEIGGIDRSSKYESYLRFEVHSLKLASRVGPHGKVINQIVVTLTQRKGVIIGKDESGDPIIAGYFSPTAPRDGWIDVTGVHTIKRDFPSDHGYEGSEMILPRNWIIFRGGSTLIFDLDYNSLGGNIKLKYVIKKDIRDRRRMFRQHRLLFEGQDRTLNATYFGRAQGNLEAEPFAIIHKVL